MSRRRGERSEKTDLESVKVLKKRNRMLERENQRLRKELRRRDVAESEVDEFSDEVTWNPPAKKPTFKCECGSEDTTTLEVSVMGKPKTYLICQAPGCKKRRRIE